MDEQLSKCPPLPEKQTAPVATIDRGVFIVTNTEQEPCPTVGVNGSDSNNSNGTHSEYRSATTPECLGTCKQTKIGAGEKRDLVMRKDDNEGGA